MPNKLCIRKANDLIEARFKLSSLAEQRLILYLIAQIKPWEKDFQDYNISVTDFCEYLELDPSNVYNEFLKISQGLVSKTLFIGQGKDTIVTAWLSSAVYHKDEGYITLQFSPKLRDFLLDLSSRYTTYSLNDVKYLKSTYSYRIYELLKQYKNQRYKERIFDVDFLKELFQVSGFYKQYNDFKKNVILTAQRELREKADIYFDFEEIKQGRKIVQIKFIIYTNSKNGPISAPEDLTLRGDIGEDRENALSKFEDVNDDGAVEIVPEFPFIAEKLTPRQRNAIYRAAGKDVGLVKRRYEAIREKPGVVDVVGYLIKVLRVPDEEFASVAPARVKGGAKNRFVNFQQRDIDFDELERLERESFLKYVED